MAQRISVIVEANDAGLSTGMRRAASTVDEFGQRTDRAGKVVTRASNEMKGAFTQLENVVERVSGRALAQFAVRALGVYAAGRAVNQALGAVIGGAVQFDAKMRNVNSISYLTDKQLGHLSSQVLNLSRVLPQSANTLAAGLYDIASSGFQGAAGVTVLTAAARAATAGLTDTATSAAAIAGVLNAYGKGANDARTVSDSLFQTVNLGVLSFADLAQGIGQVVGTASAAGVNIDQLGQAVATITKAGIVPAEAFTSLNQILAQIIQPSQALAGVFKQLGYQSGAAALQSKGLSGVMDDIRKVTGGNVTTMSQLFTDIRALRGALALTTDQGRLYAGVIRDWGTAHKGAGATAAALAEQMKSVSAQWQLFKNRVQAAAIETGTRLLPALLATMRGTADFGRALGGVLHDVTPTFHNLADVAVSLVRIIGALASVALPLAKILAVIVAVPIVAMIQGLTGALAGVLRFIEGNRIAFAAVATVLTVALLPALNAAIARFAWFTANAAAAGVLRLLGAVTLLGGGMRGLAAAMTGMISLQSVATLGLVAITAVLAGAIYSWQKAGQAAQEFVQKTERGLDALDPQNVQQISDALRQAAAEAVNAGQKYQGVFGTFRAGFDAIFGNADDIARKGLAAAEALQAISQAHGNAVANVLAVGQSTGASFTAIAEQVRRSGLLDAFSQRFDTPEAAAARKQVIADLQALARQAGVSLPQLTSETDGSIQAMQALADATKKAGDATLQAFTSSFDVIQQFDPKAGAQGIATAQQKLVDAQKKLREETARFDAQKKHSVSSDQQLAHARQGVADATNGLHDAQGKAAQTGNLDTIYRRDIRSAQNFVAEINAAIRRGLDPNEVARLLQAGPAKATPLLDALVRDHSNRLIRLSNQSERALSAISERAVEASRLTTRAVTADSDKLAHDLPKALQIDQAMAVTGGKGVAAFLKQMHLPPGEIRRIATEFGITLPRAIQQQLDAHPVRVPVTAPAPVSGPHHIGGAASGGLLSGPGTGTSDSMLARVSNGEYVVKAAAVNFYGAGVMHALNAMRMPRFAAGGLATGGSPQRASAPVVIVQGGDGAASVSHKTEINVGEVRAHDYSDFLQQMDSHRRIAAVTP